MPIPSGSSSLPAWAPTLEQVANYCTARTLLPQPDGSNAEQLGFTASTRPSAEQVAGLLADAVAWVTVRCGTIDNTLTGVAATCAAIRTAGMVELRYPERQSTNRGDAITTGEYLLRQADAMREDLHLANREITGVDPEEDGVFEALPVWSFPAVPAWGDCPI